MCFAVIYYDLLCSAMLCYVCCAVYAMLCYAALYWPSSFSGTRSVSQSFPLGSAGFVWDEGLSNSRQPKAPISHSFDLFVDDFLFAGRSFGIVIWRVVSAYEELVRGDVPKLRVCQRRVGLKSRTMMNGVS